MPFDDRFAPALDYPNVDPENLKNGPIAAGSMAAARRQLAVAMPQGQPEIAGRKDWQHLVTGQPEPAKVAGDQTAPSTGKQASADDWRHLVTGKSEPTSSELAVSSANPQEKGDFSGLFGEMGPQIRAHPYIAGGLAALATAPVLAGGGAVLTGLGALIRAYPLASQLLAASTAGAATQAGIPGAAVHSIFDLLHGFAGK